MRLISWNLNARRATASAQIAALIAQEPDIIALQEVTVSSLPLIRRALAETNLVHIADSFTLAPSDFRPQGPRRYGQLTASHLPITPQPPNPLYLGRSVS